MFKKMNLALLISCISATSYAYVINSNLTVENKTDVPLIMSIEQPNGQDPVTLKISAHTTTPIFMTNDDHTGYLYQTSIAPFKLLSADGSNKVYAQGRVAFYVGASMWNKYSFVNAVSAAEGLIVDPVYSCKNGGYDSTFDNRIIIDGTPGNELQAKEFPEAVRCQGLKSSDLSHENQYYVPNCFDGKKAPLFWRYFDGTVCTHHGNECTWIFGYTNGVYTYGVEHTEEPVVLQAALDRRVGNSYCGTW